MLKAFEDWLEILNLQISDDGILPVKSVAFTEILKNRDLIQIQNEFTRAETNCISDPPSALSAASSMVESACKLYIEMYKLGLPSNQSIKPLWNVVSKHLLPDPKNATNEDVRKLVAGLASVIEGVGTLRTHAGSAHGRGNNELSVDMTEALLAIHSAQAVVLYLVQKGM